MSDVIFILSLDLYQKSFLLNTQVFRYIIRKQVCDYVSRRRKILFSISPNKVLPKENFIYALNSKSFQRQCLFQTLSLLKPFFPTACLFGNGAVTSFVQNWVINFCWCRNKGRDIFPKEKGCIQRSKIKLAMFRPQ